MYLFDVCGFHLPIHDDRLGQALLEIGVEGYSILLLSFLLDLSDRQIALLLNSSKSSIQRRCNVTRSVSKMTEIERRGGKRWDKPKKAEKSRDCGGGKF